MRTGGMGPGAFSGSFAFGICGIAGRDEPVMRAGSVVACSAAGGSAEGGVGALRIAGRPGPGAGRPDGIPVAGILRMGGIEGAGTGRYAGGATPVTGPCCSIGCGGAAGACDGAERLEGNPGQGSAAAETPAPGCVR